MRWWLYTRLLNDSSGRVDQLTRSAPGAVIFAFALDESPVYRPSATRLLAGVRAGVPLDALLDATLEDWAMHAPELVARRGGSATVAWTRLLEATGEERVTFLRRQRLLIRRALPRVPPTLLLLPPPLQFAPEDIPRTVRANAHWYRVMKGSAATLGHRADTRPEAVAFSMFASLHAAAIRRTDTQTVREIMHTLASYCTATGRVPARNTSPSRLLQEAQAWAARLDRLTRTAPSSPSSRSPEAVLALKLPVDDKLAWQSGTLTITPLRTVRELFDEGARMRNCAARRAPSVFGQQTVVCRATINGHPHTLEARKTHTGWTLVDLRAFANAKPTAAEFEALQPWLVARNVTCNLPLAALLRHNDQVGGREGCLSTTPSHSRFDHGGRIRLPERFLRG